jgi:hypothetical protein
MIAAWENDEALDEFFAGTTRWPGLSGLSEGETKVGDEEPVAVLTLGRPRLSRLPAFLKASAGAEAEAVANPDVLALIGLARPPRLVATFSLWRNVKAMRAYARGSSDGAHPGATKTDRVNPFHHDSAFIRFRPYASQGNWDGRDPLALAT